MVRKIRSRSFPLIPAHSRSLVFQYGALTFALVMVIRQFTSILFSCWIFKHSLSMGQWVGCLLVVSGLYQRAVGKSKGLPVNMKDVSSAAK